jgi:hypothetical protein
MARAAPTLPISPKMFRHFAVITVAITACIALLADGEGKEALAAQVKERQQKNDLLIAEADKVGKRTVGFDQTIARKAAVADSDGEGYDEGGSFGEPMDAGSGAGDEAASPRSRGPIGGLIGPGSGKLLPPQLRQPGARASQAGKPSPAQLDKIEEASKLRSGARE